VTATKTKNKLGIEGLHCGKVLCRLKEIFQKQDKRGKIFLSDVQHLFDDIK